MKDDGVAAAVTIVGFGDEFGTDGDLGGETDDAGADLIFD